MKLMRPMAKYPLDADKVKEYNKKELRSEPAVLNWKKSLTLQAW